VACAAARAACCDAADAYATDVLVTAAASAAAIDIRASAGESGAGYRGMTWTEDRLHAGMLDRNIKIWKSYSLGMPQKALAREFGISPSRVWQIYHTIDGRVRCALKGLRPNTDPWVYNVWFCFELGHPDVVIKE
jgi:hypothetical protein